MVHTHHTVTRLVIGFCSFPICCKQQSGLPFDLIEAHNLLFTTHRKSEEGVIGGWSIPGAIIPSCQDMETIAL